MKKTNYEFNFLFQKSKRGAVAEIKVINIQIHLTAGFFLRPRTTPRENARKLPVRPPGRNCSRGPPQPPGSSLPGDLTWEQLPRGARVPGRRPRPSRPHPRAETGQNSPPSAPRPGTRCRAASSRCRGSPGAGVGRRGKAPAAPPPTPSPTPHPWGPASETAPLSRTLRGGQAPPPPTPPCRRLLPEEASGWCLLEACEPSCAAEPRPHRPPPPPDPSWRPPHQQGKMPRPRQTRAQREGQR